MIDDYSGGNSTPNRTRSYMPPRIYEYEWKTVLKSDTPQPSIEKDAKKKKNNKRPDFNV